MAPAGDLRRVSRYTSKRLAWAHGDEADQLEYLRALADRHHLDGWTLFSTTDETTAFCARHCAELSARFRVTVAPWDVLGGHTTSGSRIDWRRKPASTSP